jgi:uncharacterized damage-inducible protein DinB
MDLLDRLLGHDAWTTRQLLQACRALPDELLDREFEIDHRSLRRTFTHIIKNMEIWTDLLYERPVQPKSGDSIPELLERLDIASRDFAALAQKVAREQRYDDCFLDVLDNPPQLKSFGGVIGHLITHSMHHRAQVMFLMEQVGLKEHIEGDLLSWEAANFPPCSRRKK